MQDHESKPIDPRVYLRAIWRRKWLLVVPVIAGAVTGFIIGEVLDPIYEAKSTVVMRTQERLSEPLARLVGRSPMEEQLARLQEKVKSHTFLVELVRTLDMADDPAVQRWARRMHEDNPSITVQELAEERVIQFLKTRIAVVRTTENAFQVIARDFEPERATLLAQHITNAFVSSSNREQIEQIRAVHDFSVEQLMLYKDRLDEAEERLQEFQEGRITSDYAENPVNPSTVGRVEMLVSQATIEGDRAASRLSERRQSLSDVSGAFLQDLLDLSSDSLRELMSGLVALERQVAPILITSAQTGPEVTSLYVGIAEQKDRLRDAARALAATVVPEASPQLLDAFAEFKIAEVEVQMVEERRSRLARMVWSYTQGRASAPEQEIELARLIQEVESNRAFYEAFLEQSAAGQITEALEAARAGGRFEVIEPPRRPITPVAPDRPMILVLSILGGTVVGLGAILATEQSDSSFKDLEDIQEFVNLPVLATLPDTDAFRALARREKNMRRTGTRPTGGNSPVIKHIMRETPVTFEFRRMARRLAKARGREPRSVLVTSANRGEGKSTSAACLAITLAKQYPGRTALVECDLRKPRLHRLMEVESRPGLSDALERGHLAESDFKTTSLPNLFVLPCGTRTKEVTRVIEEFASSGVLAELLSRFDHVVFDTAPNVAVPDALMLGGEVDAVVLVVKAGATPREVVTRGITMQSEEKDNVFGLVVNNLEHVLPYYYDYKYYGYATEESENGDADGS